MVEIITKKRNGSELSDKEIFWLIDAYVSDKVPDYQMSAFLMAIYFNGMTLRETSALTLAMAKSGKMVNLSDIPGIKIDKHSTGGVADTTTLIVAPLVAAAGVHVAKMSGRGLGFTGGTIDKLESIPGFNTALTEREFMTVLKQHQLAITGQTASIAPADGKMYALRDVTATIESIPLIASSIMSKKIASGADKILLDVKVGSGAFMKTLDEAVNLAKTMVSIGKMVERETMALISSMEQPLGSAVGNSLEVKEAIAVLSGQGPSELREVCLKLGAYMLVLAGKVSDYKMGIDILTRLIDNGYALSKFQEFITAQGGCPDIIENQGVLPKASYEIPILSRVEGFVSEIKADKLGLVAMRLGAGREIKGTAIDLSAGLIINVRVGNRITKGQSLVTLHVNNQDKAQMVIESVYDAIKIVSAEEKISKPSLILGMVDANGFHPVA